MYTFSLGTVRNVDKTNFSRLNNQYELSFHAQSIIKPVLDDQSIKKQQLSIVKIRNIAEYSTNSIIDVVGVVRGYSELALITATKYSEKQFLKRELTLVDDSLCEVRLTLWNDHANVKCDWSMYPILVLKGVKVQDYQGRSLVSTSCSILSINPEIREVECLSEVRKSLFDKSFSSEMSLSNSGMYILYNSLL